MPVTGSLDVRVEGTRIPAYYSFDGDLLQVHLPGITPMPLWANHATEYGSIYLLRQLFDAGMVVQAESLVLLMFVSVITELIEYEMMVASSVATEVAILFAVAI